MSVDVKIKMILTGEDKIPTGAGPHYGGGRFDRDLEIWSIRPVNDDHLLAPAPAAQGDIFHCSGGIEIKLSPEIG